jgi:hypothetical protein
MIVMFSSGEYSDYGLAGLMEVDPEVYEVAKASYDRLGKEWKALQEDLNKQANAGNITANQTAEIVKEIDSFRKKRYDVWEICRKTGTPVDFTEFWQGDFY